jgi:hypothetical protein
VWFTVFRNDEFKGTKEFSRFRDGDRLHGRFRRQSSTSRSDENVE